MQGEADEAAAEARETDEKAKRFMLDAAKLAEELRYRCFKAIIFYVSR